MNKDVLLVTCLLLMVAAAGVGFFLVSDALEEPTEFVDDERDDGTAETVEPKKKIRRAKATTEPTTSPGSADNPNSTDPDAEDAESGDSMIVGTVRASNGDPVPEALVALCVDLSNLPHYSLQGPVRSSLKTDGNGQFEFVGFSPHDRYVLRVEHLAFASKFVPRVEVKEGEKKTVNIRLDDGHELKGTVTDMTGAPLVDVEVLVFDQQNRAMDPTDNVERTAQTDSNGEFVFANLNPGYKRVSARKIGFATETNQAVNIQKNKVTPDIKFKLGEGSFIGGLVVDQNKQPIEDVVITAQPLSRSGRGVPAANYPSVKSDADGRFRYEGLAPGTYSLHAYKKGYGSSRRFTAKTGIETAELQLKRKPLVRGRVVDAITGEPVADFAVTLGRQEFMVFDSPQVTQRFTAENGEFEYQNAVTGDFYLFGRAKGYAGGRSEKISATEGVHVDGIIIRLTKGTQVVGRIVDALGKPVAGARLALVPRMGNESGAANPFQGLIENSMRKAKKKTRSGANGEYRFKNVDDGYYVVRADASGFADAVLQNAVLVSKDQSETRFPDLVVMRGGTIEGIVLDKAGNPAPNSTVQIAPKGQIGATSYTVKTDAQGKFIQKNVRPGIYFVDAATIAGEQVNPFEKLLGGAGGKRQELMIGDGEVQRVELR